jgi:hypothetical protein
VSGQIQVSAPYAFASLEILDAGLNTLATGTDLLAADVAAGLYVVRARVGEDEAERFISVDDDATVRVRFDDLALQEPLAIDGETAEAGDGARAGPEVVVATEVPEGSEPPNVALVDGHERILGSLNRIEPGATVAGWRTPLEPGTYGLEFDMLDLGRRCQPVLVARGFDTHVFVRSGRGRGPRVQLYLRPAGAMREDVAAYGAVDSALDGYLHDRVVLSPHDRKALEAGVLEDPMLALLATAASLRAGDAPAARRGCMSLERLVPHSPDLPVMRLLLRRPSGPFVPVGDPPLLAELTRRLLELSIDHPELIPLDSWLARVAPRLRSGDPWTRWAADVTPGQARDDLVRGVLAARGSRAAAGSASLDSLPSAVVGDARVPALAGLRADVRRYVGVPVRRPILRTVQRKWGRRLQRFDLRGARRVRAHPPPVDHLERTSAQLRKERSSRTSAEAAGWPRQGGEHQTADWPLRLSRLKNRRWRDFSWLTARALLDSANDEVAKLIHDLVNDRRQRWTAAQRAAGVLEKHRDLVVGRRNARSCLILGDPGEADGSQYAVIRPMLEVDRALGSDFMVVLSDVIYPAGDVNAYVNGFYEAYREYEKPIFALPGNHDWYDGLNGFMFHFCGAEALGPTAYRQSSYSPPERVAGMLWRKADRPDRTLLNEHRSRRGERGALDQPGPYWAMDIDGVRLIAIDTGIKGTIDREQGEWLLRVSLSSDQPNVLLTGKPLWVDGEYKPTPIEWGDKSGPPEIDWDRRALPDRPIETVDDIVCHEAFGYVAAIGGDVHNYQRLTVRVKAPEERRIEYIVAGGSGAYMSPTHAIGKVGESLPQSKKERKKEAKRPKPPPGVEPVKDEDFRCYPTRGDSLAYYSDWFGQRIVKGQRGSFVVMVAAAAALTALALAGHIAHGWAAVLGATVLGVALTLGVPVAAMMVTYKLFAPHYKTAGGLLAAPATLIGLYALADLMVGDWVRAAMLVGTGTLLTPIVLTLVGYYGFSSERQLKRDFVGCAAIVVVVVVGLHRHAALAVDLLTVTLAVTAIALLLLATGRVRAFFDDPQPERRRADGLARAVRRRIEKARRTPWEWIPFTVAIYSVIPAALVVIYWDVAEVRFIPIAVAGIALLLSAAVLTVIGFGGRKALKDLRTHGPLDPDEALSYLYYLGIIETLPDPANPRRPARIRDFSYRTARVCNLLLPSARGPRKLLSSRINEIGNADVPPMFKSFVRLAIEDGELVITCYGVPGWKEHETDVPVEDRVRIPLDSEPVTSRASST